MPPALRERLYIQSYPSCLWVPYHGADPLPYPLEEGLGLAIVPEPESEIASSSA